MGKCDRHAVPASPAPLTPQLRVRGYARRRSYAMWREPKMPWASGAPLRRRSPRGRCHPGDVGLVVLHVDDHDQCINVCVILVLTRIFVDYEVQPQPQSFEVLVIDLEGRDAFGHTVKLRLEARLSP